ncbi:MAG: heavy metal translocating P-type ATPase [Candidatus Nanohalobium sp.]
MGSDQVQYNVGGMSCSFCAETIEKAYRRTDGVEEADVSLAHEEVLVKYDDEVVTEVEVKDTLRNLGYTIRDPDKEKRFEEQKEELEQGRNRLLVSGAASILGLMMMAVMVVRGGWSISIETERQWMWFGSLLLAVVTMVWPGRYIMEKAYNSLKRGIFNQHVLLEAGAFAGLAGGFLGWFVFKDFPVVHFFLVSTFITTYHILSEYTSLVVRTRASRAVNDLMDLQPDTARRVTEDGEEEEVEVDKLEVGDRVRVKPGENIPVDGEVVEGGSAVDESVATGESTPIDKTEGDEVIGGSVNETGTLLVEVTATGEDAFLNQVAQQIEEARAMKPGIVQLADRILKYFVPGVLSIAALSFLFWTFAPAVIPGTILGADPQVQTAVFAALSVLVLGYPCALGMATPLALIRGGGEAARNGILMRSGDAFQAYRDVDTVVLDKTGTITEGEPAVDTVVGIESSEEEMIQKAATAETFSEHPIAEAILEYTEEKNLGFPDPDEFESVTGKGVKASSNGNELIVGKPGWLEEEGIDLEGGEEEIEELQGRGLTTIGVAEDGTLIGLIGIGDEVKEDASETVKRMKEAGINPVMITGDNERTAEAVAGEVGIDTVMAEVLPDDKRNEIQRLQVEEDKRVAMVGDGINDAPALTQADVGIAIGAGTDIAIESADIVLMGDRLGGVIDAYEIAQTTYRKTRQNLIGAFSFNGVGVAAATTGLVHPVFAMIAMILSVSAVLANSFAGQLLSKKGLKTDFTVEKADDREHSNHEEDTEQDEDERPGREETSLDVNLHCGGCEQRVKENLAEAEGVDSVSADADQERVVVRYNPHVVSVGDLESRIEELGYNAEKT